MTLRVESPDGVLETGLDEVSTAGVFDGLGTGVFNPDSEVRQRF